METNFKVDVPSFALGYSAGKKKGGSGGGSAVLGKLTATENGVYDKPTAIVPADPAKVAKDAVFYLQEKITLSQGLKDQLQAYKDSGGYLNVHNKNNHYVDFEFYQDGSYVITYYDGSDIGCIYVPEEVLASQEAIEYVGITDSGWYLLDWNAMTVTTPCDPPSISIGYDNEVSNGLATWQAYDMYRLIANEVLGMEAPADGWDKVTVNVPTIIDVTEIPTDGINDSATYRMSINAQMYVRDSWSGEILTLQELADSTNGYWVELHIVESLPEQMSPINHDRLELPVYVVESTGIGYVSEIGSSSDAVPLSEYNFYSGAPSYFPDKGIVESTDDITEAGWYFIPGKKNISLHIHSAEGWTNYIRSEAN